MAVKGSAWEANGAASGSAWAAGFAFGEQAPYAWFGNGQRRDRDGRIGDAFCVLLIDHELVLEGELDLATAPVLERALLDVERRLGREPLAIDLRRLEFMDCAGLRIIIDASARARRARRPFELRAGAGEPARLLAASGLDSVLAFLGRLRPIG